MNDAMVPANVYTICCVVQVSVEYAIFDLTDCGLGLINNETYYCMSSTHRKLLHKLSMQINEDLRHRIAHSGIRRQHEL